MKVTRLAGWPALSRAFLLRCRSPGLPVILTQELDKRKGDPFDKVALVFL
jgi:hypothetical protein